MKFKKLVAFVIAIFCVCVLSACGSKSIKLSKKAQDVTGKNADNNFINTQTKFALELFQKAVDTSESGQNIMISPYSVVQAFGMTANGANGDTKSQIEQIFGNMSTEDLNQYLYDLRISQPNDKTCKLLTANSIWIRDDSQGIQVKENFLQTNANYYDSSVFKAPFDNSTVKEINNWVAKNTDNMIPEMLNQISDNAVIYLINAITFDSQWASIYEDVSTGNFTTIDNSKQEVPMMYSTEYDYLEDENTTGFLKYYQGNRYAFMALLPNKNITITDYIKNLTPESLQNFIKNPEKITVETALPKFSYDYEIELSSLLSTMGMPNAFDETADFSNMTDSFVKISQVVHKTHISVFEEGTKAVAITDMEFDGAMDILEAKTVILDRPFVYAIVDMEHNLPIFLGVLNSVPQ
ncbi:MAG: serpin family protein [Oscillospiraceae bacterium]|nr:serpin family protein [Oscillospiraceae bacterium]